MSRPKSQTESRTTVATTPPVSVAIDMESTLAATHEEVLRRYNQEHDTAYTPDEIDSWSWVIEELAPGEFEHISHEMWRTPAEVPPDVPSVAIESAINRLATRDGVTVDVVTARSGRVGEMYDWCQSHGLSEVNTLLSTNGAPKIEYAYDVYVDDKPALAQKVQEDPTKRLYLIDRPYNQDIKEIGGVDRVQNVVNAVGYLNRAISWNAP